MNAYKRRSWERLPEHEKKIINEICADLVTKQVEHEEAQLQKRWLQLAFVVLHNSKDRYGKSRCLAFLVGFKKVYRICSKFKTEAEIESWLEKEMTAIFGKDGYPHEWVDSIEK